MTLSDCSYDVKPKLLCLYVLRSLFTATVLSGSERNLGMWHPYTRQMVMGG